MEVDERKEVILEEREASSVSAYPVKAYRCSTLLCPEHLENPINSNRYPPQ
ncbi:hypothetical protein J6590_061526 [Homalodisca vitripennis]|nr:hypothetical protein J6590_061526 [Homalodisca vitripennis]